MDASDQKITSMQYSLALLIGQELDLVRMLRKFLPPALRLLQCSKGYVWLSDGEVLQEYGYPRVDDVLAGFNETAKAVFADIQAQDFKLFRPLNVNNGDVFLHFLPIGHLGVIVFERYEKLPEAFVFALKPIMNRLELACRACFQHQREMTIKQELVEAKDAAIAASKAKSEFLALVSHEIRTPMNAIVGFTDLLAFSPLNDEQREHVRYIKQSSDKLLGVINQILDLSRIEEGDLTLEVEVVDLRELLQSCFDLYQPNAEAKSLAFTADIGDVSPFVAIDAQRLKQVLVNILSNAVKFTESGAIYIAACETDGVLTITVSDTGIGISEEHVQAILEPFSKADLSFSRSHDGIGIGLSISAQLIQLLGGEIDVKSLVGEGSEFKISLPLTLAEPVDPKQRAIENIERSINALKILLVEDNPVNRIVAETMLKKAGHNVVVAENGELAVERWQDSAPDLILMDIQMPVMDGLTATREIRRLESADAHAIIIALTANASDADRENCKDVGMDAFIPKPFESQQLFSVIESLGARGV